MPIPTRFHGILAVLAGIAVAVGLVTLTDLLAGRLGATTTAMVLLGLGWGIAAAAGAATATLLSPGRAARGGRVVTILVFASTVLNLSNVPHPAWLWGVALAAVAAGGLLATRALAR